MAEHIYPQRRDLTGRHTIAALFPNWTSAEQAIRELQAAGFTGDQVGVAMRDRTAQGELVEGTGMQAAEAAATGAVGGGLLGGLTGFRAGGVLVTVAAGERVLEALAILDRHGADTGPGAVG